MKDATQFYIDGEWVRPREGTPFTVLNPSNEEAFATITLGGQADTNAAVAAAKAALPAWKSTTKAERADVLRRVLGRMHFAEAAELLITRLDDVEKTDDFLERFTVDPEA